MFLLALALYVPGLGNPATLVFDEGHYVPVVRHFRDQDFINPAFAPQTLPYNFEHPPLGKLLMWVGVAATDSPLGWRIMGALAGAVGVAAMFLLGNRLFVSPTAGAIAAFCLLAENLYYANAQLGLLDVFQVSFGIAAIAAALGSHRERRLAPVVLGLALSAKYTALFLLPAFAATLFLAAPPFHSFRRRLLVAVRDSLAVPLAVLLFSYLPYFIVWARILGPSAVPGAWLETQGALLAWDYTGARWHPCGSPPGEWIPMVWPTFYFQRLGTDGTVQYIHALGNPAVWWGGAVAAIAAPLVLLRCHRGALRAAFDVRAWTFPASGSGRLSLAALLCASSYVPFFLLERTTYSFYMTSVSPYLALLAGGAIFLLANRPDRRTLAILWAGAVAAFFAFYFPYSEGLPIPGRVGHVLDQLLPWVKLNCPIGADHWSPR